MGFDTGWGDEERLQSLAIPRDKGFRLSQNKHIVQLVVEDRDWYTAYHKQPDGPRPVFVHLCTLDAIRAVLDAAAFGQNEDTDKVFYGKKPKREEV